MGIITIIECYTTQGTLLRLKPIVALLLVNTRFHCFCVTDVVKLCNLQRNAAHFPGGILCGYLQQMLFCVTMVRTVSPNWVRVTPSSSSSSMLSRQASQLARAVMDAVSWQAFITSPSNPSYALAMSSGIRSIGFFRRKGPKICLQPCCNP